MLRKLLKHEFRATARIMLPLYLILLATAFGSNLSGRWMVGSHHEALSILGVLIVMAFGIAIVAVFVVAFIMMVQRFYKNLLQDEGYLMFTLPVSVHQHIWSKLIVSAVWFIATVLAVILASLIVASDVSVLEELFGILRELFQSIRMLKISEALNGTVILAEFFGLIFLALMAFSLQFYAALAAGHSRSGHKMVWSVVLFFAFQFAVQFFGALLFAGLDKVDFFHIMIQPYLAIDVNLRGAAAVHIGLLLAIAVVAAYGAIFYAVTTFFLKKHLNLE